VAWLAQIPAFLDGVALDPWPRPVLLHTEVMREHLLVTSHAGGWSLSGPFDFEPAMRGAREYEFASVGLFVSRGDAGFLRRVLIAYGDPPGRLDDALSRRLLAYACCTAPATSTGTCGSCRRRRSPPWTPWRRAGGACEP
jgi:hygromycin-B 7''-O-kinase